MSGTPTQSGSFPLTVRVTDANGCSATSATYTLVVIDPTPTLAALEASPSAVCVGSPVTFTATVGNVTGSYNYILTNGSSTSIAGTSSNTSFSQTLTASGAGSQSFTLTVSANGQAASATTNVTVNSLPTAGLTNNGPLSCATTSVTLTASGGTSFTFANGSGTLGTPVASNTLVVSSPGTYSVSVANASGCVSSTTTTVLSATGTVAVSNPGITSGTLTAAFSQSFTASGGSGPYSYSLASGSLPAGLNLNTTTGLVSGTPTQSGSFPLTVRATDANGCSGTSATYTLVVIDPTPTLAALGATPSAVCVGSPVTFTATIGNVTGSYNYTLTNGLSTPLTGTSSSATFSQLATASGSGTQSFTLTVSANGQAASATTSLTVNSLPVAGLTNNGPLSCATTSVTLTASGGTSFTFANGSGTLGTPGATNTLVVSSPGTYSVTVANASGCVSSTTTTVLSATGTVTLTNPATTTATLNSAFSQSFTASGGSGPYSYSLASGSLPTGLSLNTTTGLVSGTPTQSGSFPLTVRATDANGCSATSATYTLVVIDPTPTLTGLSASPSAVCIGSPVTFTASVGNVTGSYSYTLTNGLSTPLTGTSSSATFSQLVTASGTGVQSFTLTVSANGQSATSVTPVTVNSLPVAGLTNNGPLSCATTSVTLTASGGTSFTFANGSGTLGTPGATNTLVVSSPGTYSVTVANASGCVSSTTTTVLSATGTVTVSNPATTTATLSSAFSQSFTASGGSGPYSYSLASGSLPAGLSLNTTTGVVSGTPTQSGSFPLTVRATDANGCSATSATYTLTVLGGQLAVAAPDYNCATGAITFHVTGGDGTPIEFFAPGVTPWTTNPNQTVEINLQADPKKFVIYARQSGMQSSYLFDLPAYCAGLPTPPQSTTSPGPFIAQGITAQTTTQNQPYSFSIPAGTFIQPQGLPLTYTMLGLPSGLSFSGTTLSGTPIIAGRKTVTVVAVDASGQTANTSFSLAVNPPNPPAPTGDPFQLLAPVYNCSGGWITFQTTGGNGTAVEFYAEGITDWTSLATQEVPEQLRDHPTTVLLKARQNGVEVSRRVDLAALCQPDLTPLLSTSPSTIYGTSTLNVVVDVVELNSRSSNGLIQVYLAKDPLFSLSFDPATTSVLGRRVQNTVWQFDATSSESFYILSTRGLGAGAKVSVGLIGQLRPGNTKGRLSISALVMGSAIGELQLSNNSDADLIEYFNK
ncbi:hypothetical protein GCM10028774_44990 [Spirosoma jeollabukense]